MFNRSRIRIVLTVVISLIALMTVTLTTIYLSNRAALQRENEQMLRTYAERYTLGVRKDGPEGMRGPNDLRMDRNEPMFRLSTFYAVAFSEDGKAIEINNGNVRMMSDDELIETAAAILESGKRSGTNGNMTYLAEKRSGYTLVAMIDGTVTAKNLQTLIRQMLIVGAPALLALFALAVFFAGRIVRPLEENDRKQKRFVSDAGHELKTPIAVISANSELLRRQIGDSEWLDGIDYENERMSVLVKQLLELSRAESGEAPREPLDLSELVTGEVLPFEALAFEKGREIETHIEEGITVCGDRNRLKQLVSILIDNALSHGTGGKIDLTLKKEKRTAVLSVSNEAEKPDGEKLSHLFDRFYRADEARSDGSHYGLGLSIAKATAEAHGGEIRAQYKDGRMVFTVSVPVKFGG